MKWVKNHEFSCSNSSRDKNTSPTLGGQSYLVPVVGGRWQVSHGFSQGVRKLTQTPRLSKRNFNILMSSMVRILKIESVEFKCRICLYAHSDCKPNHSSLWWIIILIDSYFASVQAAFLAMKSTGGKLLVFQSGKVLSTAIFMYYVQVQPCVSKINCICLHACIKTSFIADPTSHLQCTADRLCCFYSFMLNFWFQCNLPK